MDFKNRKYKFLISGYDGGKAISPYIVICSIEDLEAHLFTYGDSIRYYEEL